MGLMNDMIKIDMENTAEKERESSVSAMFKSKRNDTVVLQKPSELSSQSSARPYKSQRGTHGYSSGTDRKMVQVTTRLTEDNYAYLEEFAKNNGLNRAGLISYAINYIIDEKRGLR